MKSGDTAPSKKSRKIFLDFCKRCVIIVQNGDPNMFNMLLMPLVMTMAIVRPAITYEIVTNEVEQHEVYAFDGDIYEETADYIIYTLDAGACVLRDSYASSITKEILRYNDSHYQVNHFGLHLDASMGVCVMTVLRIPNNLHVSLQINNFRRHYNQHYYYHREAPIYFPYKMVKPRAKRARKRHRHHHKHVKPAKRHHHKKYKRHRPQKRHKKAKSPPKHQNYKNNNEKKRKKRKKHNKKARRGPPPR